MLLKLVIFAIVQVLSSASESGIWPFTQPKPSTPAWKVWTIAAAQQDSEVKSCVALGSSYIQSKATLSGKLPFTQILTTTTLNSVRSQDINKKTTNYEISVTLSNNNGYTLNGTFTVAYNNGGNMQVTEYDFDVKYNPPTPALGPITDLPAGNYSSWLIKGMAAYGQAVVVADALLTGKIGLFDILTLESFSNVKYQTYGSNIFYNFTTVNLKCLLNPKRNIAANFSIYYNPSTGLYIVKSFWYNVGTNPSNPNPPTNNTNTTNPNPPTNNTNTTNPNPPTNNTNTTNPNPPTNNTNTTNPNPPTNNTNTTEPTPQEPTPQEPTPQEPTPQEPTPQEPTPQEPTPQEPTPQEPTPQEPTPQEPTPQEPTPQEPTPQNLLSKKLTSRTVKVFSKCVEKDCPIINSRDDATHKLGHKFRPQDVLSV